VSALLELRQAASNGTQRIEASRQLCDLDVDECDLLGNDLMAAGQEEEAADTLDRYVFEAGDKMNVSQRVSWLVRYHDDAGRTDQAFDIAQRAANIGSAAGMQTLAFLYDRHGDDAQAERLYERIRSRYDDPVELGTFYIRRGRRTQNAGDQAKGAALLKTPFPRGIEAVTLQSFTESPHDGVRFFDLGERAIGIGLREDDVLVAVDGVRVRTAWQYGIAAKFSHDPVMVVIVWREGKYQELKLTVPQRLFGVRYDTYKTS
jgi:tetratricopeptide (TPR) repeat protein